MTKIRNEKPLDDNAYELLVAEEELILHAQMLIQRVLNAQGISQKELAAKMGVGESYVSQMLGLSPRNLTLRTIARVMRALGVKATLALDEYGEDMALVNADVEATAAQNDNASAVASRMASVQLSQVWSELIEMPARRNDRRRHETDARAFAAHEPSVHEMEMDLEMALAA